ncbi:MAG: hypothetical protein ACOY4H_14500 [Thermodesulfobacteriota bacterium]
MQWPEAGKQGGMVPCRLDSIARLLALLTMLFCAAANVAEAEEYSFDLSEFEKKPYHLSGYVELRPMLFGLDHDAALYRLRIFDQDEDDTTAEHNGRLQLEGSLEKGMSRLFVRANGDYRASYLGESITATVYDAFLSFKPTASLGLEAGKKSLRWGTGYAWNPVAFLDRLKDPDDPELDLEGFVLASATCIRSFAGPLRTLSLAPVLLPVRGKMNDDFGKSEHLNAGGKLYFLLYDTDIDLLFLTGGSRTNRYGVDFARNLAANFEVHGEFAYIRRVHKQIVQSTGAIFEQEEDAQNWLVGIRYLTEAETTWIVEYYHNGGGYSREEMENFFRFIDQGYDDFQANGDTGLLQKAKNLAERGYGRMNPMRNYLYLRASQKDPFDILYFTPAITAISNLDDGSLSLSPELLYMGITDLELRVKGSWLVGSRLNEYGEKQNNWRLEFRVRYSF